MQNCSLGFILHKTLQDKCYGINLALLFLICVSVKNVSVVENMFCTNSLLVLGNDHLQITKNAVLFPRTFGLSKLVCAGEDHFYIFNKIPCLLLTFVQCLICSI